LDGRKGLSEIVKILQFIMSYGIGYMLVMATGIFLCVGAFPSLSKACVEVTPLEIASITRAGFTPVILGTTIYGTIVYVLSLKGSKN